MSISVIATSRGQTTNHRTKNLGSNYQYPVKIIKFFKIMSLKNHVVLHNFSYKYHTSYLKVYIPKTSVYADCVCCITWPGLQEQVLSMTMAFQSCIHAISSASYKPRGIRFRVYLVDSASLLPIHEQTPHSQAQSAPAKESTCLYCFKMPVSILYNHRNYYIKYMRIHTHGIGYQIKDD